MSENGKASSQSNYPGANTTDEALRLRAQHNLVVQALGGLVLCHIDLSKPDFNVLDSATADGYYLRMIRQQLKHPESATLIGTDVMEYPTNQEGNETDSIQFRTQNVLDPWPNELHGKFDFVHQRALMANVPGHDNAVDVVRRLIQLVKPGGWIQLVDAEMPNEEISEGDSPSTKLWKTIGSFLHKTGLDLSHGSKLDQLLADAGGVKNIGARTARVKLGKGCAPGLEKDSAIELRGLREVLGGAIKKVPNPSISYEDFLPIADEALKEAEEKGIEMRWYAAWAQRSE